MFQLRPLPRTLDAALRDAEDRKVSVRRSALRDLARLAAGEQRSQVVAGLCQRLLADEDAEVRADAALALADAEARVALEPLLEAARDPHLRVRQMVLVALGELSPKGHKGTCAVIEEALTAELPALRFQALLAAQKLEPGCLVDSLSQAVKDPDPSIRYLALRLIDERLAQSALSREAVGRGEPSSDEHRGLLRVAHAALADSTLTVRVAAALVLAPRGDASARVPLVEALNRGVKLPALEDEQELIETAGELGLKAAEPGLIRHAWGRFGIVPGRFAWQAKVALARVGNARARQEILRGLGSWDRDTRNLAVVAAGRAALAEAKPLLVKMREAKKADSVMLREALRQLD